MMKIDKIIDEKFQLSALGLKFRIFITSTSFIRIKLHSMYHLINFCWTRTIKTDNQVETVDSCVGMYLQNKINYEYTVTVDNELFSSELTSISKFSYT